MITISFQGEAKTVFEDIRAFINTAYIDTPAPKELPATSASTGKPKKVAPASVQEVTATVEPTPAPAEPATTAPTALPLADQVKDLVLKVAKVKGRQTAVELLAKYGAKAGSDVKEADRAAFVAEATALIPA